jgi:hypothetical protein
MHGQKKRRKRFKEGSLAVDGFRLNWRVVSEPLWSTAHGYKGLCISVRTEDGGYRELLLEYPFPRKKDGTFQLPPRPKFSEKTVEADIRKAIAAGCQPDSRGKTFTHHLP